LFDRFMKIFESFQSESVGTQVHSARHKIEFDMLLKGTLYDRSNGQVRQCAVTVNGATKLVTSGDVVGQDIYDALVEYGAIAPIPKKKSEKPLEKE
jgi:hypothetical protein